MTALSDRQLPGWLTQLESREAGERENYYTPRDIL